MVPWRLKHVAETGTGACSKTEQVEGRGKEKKVVVKYAYRAMSADITYSSDEFGHLCPRSSWFRHNRK